MNLSRVILFLSWGANRGDAFAPSMLVSRRDVIKTYLSASTASAVEKNAKKKTTEARHCIPLQEIGLDDLPKVGGKTASLGEMIQKLTPLGVSVPGGFGVCSTAYDAVLDRFQLRERLDLLMSDVDVNNIDDLANRGRQAHLMIMNAGLPPEVVEQIEEAYDSISNKPRSSTWSASTAFATPSLNAWRLFFTDRAIAYRVHNGFDHMQVKGAVSIQLCPDTGFHDVVVITGSYGLGESVVGGKVDPDEIQVFKPMIGKAEDPIIKRSIGCKQTQIVYSRDGSDKRVKTILTPDADASKHCFSDEEAKTLAEWCVKIEKHYSKHHGHPTPMNIEWAKDSITGELFIVQARPETVRSAQASNLLKQTQVTEHEPPIVEGNAIGSDAASGKARVMRDVSQLSTMKPGEIIVAGMTLFGTGIYRFCS
ncbi:hypothetical protein ACHAWF_011946 [Thalassiosira exigua]